MKNRLFSVLREVFGILQEGEASRNRNLWVLPPPPQSIGFNAGLCLCVSVSGWGVNGIVLHRSSPRLFHRIRAGVRRSRAREKRLLLAFFCWLSRMAVKFSYLRFVLDRQAPHRVILKIPLVQNL